MELLKQIHVKYPFIMVGLIILCLSYMHLTGQYDEFPGKSPVEAIIFMFAPLVIWFLGIRAKKKQQKGKLTFKEGMKEAWKMTVVFAIISPFVFLAYYMMNPGIVAYVGREYRMPEASWGTVVMVDLFAQFVGSLIFGIIYGAIASFFLKSK